MKSRDRQAPGAGLACSPLRRGLCFVSPVQRTGSRLYEDAAEARSVTPRMPGTEADGQSSATPLRGILTPLASRGSCRAPSAEPEARDP